MSARDDLIDDYGRAETGMPPWSLAELRQRLDEVAAEAVADAAGKDTRKGESTLSCDVLDLLAAIRDALDVPTPALGTPGGYDEMFRLTHRRAAAVRLAAEVAVRMGTPHWGVLAEGVTGAVKRSPITYPVWQSAAQDETGGEQA